MGIGIALNTIVILLTLITPGLIFRKIFFKQFKRLSSNQFESIIWNIVFSILLIIILNIFFEIILKNIRIPLIDSYINFKDNIICNFKLIHSGDYPKVLDSITSLKDLIFVFFSLYMLSIILSYTSSFIVEKFKLYLLFPILNPNTFWINVRRANKKYNIKDSVVSDFISYIFIKTKENKLYEGKYIDEIFDKDGQIESFIIKDVYSFNFLDYNKDQNKISEIKRIIKSSEDMTQSPKFNKPMIYTHLDQYPRFIYKKQIKCDLMSIPYNQIADTSIEFYKIKDNRKKIESFIVSTLFVLFIGFFISYMIWDFQIIKLNGTVSRIAFCILTPLNILFIIDFLILLYKKDEKTKKRNYNKIWLHIFVIIFISSWYIVILESPPFLEDLSMSWKKNITFGLVIASYFAIIANRNKSTEK